jgi:hypothetical protein
MTVGERIARRAGYTFSTDADKRIARDRRAEQALRHQQRLAKQIIEDEEGYPAEALHRLTEEAGLALTDPIVKQYLKNLPDDESRQEAADWVAEWAESVKEEYAEAAADRQMALQAQAAAEYTEALEQMEAGIARFAQENADWLEENRDAFQAALAEVPAPADGNPLAALDGLQVAKRLVEAAERQAEGNRIAENLHVDMGPGFEVVVDGTDILEDVISPGAAEARDQAIAQAMLDAEPQVPDHERAAALAFQRQEAMTPAERAKHRAVVSSEATVVDVSDPIAAARDILGEHLVVE